MFPDSRSEWLTAGGTRNGGPDMNEGANQTLALPTQMILAIGFPDHTAAQEPWDACLHDLLTFKGA